MKSLVLLALLLCALEAWAESEHRYFPLRTPLKAGVIELPPSQFRHDLDEVYARLTVGPACTVGQTWTSSVGPMTSEPCDCLAQMEAAMRAMDRIINSGLYPDEQWNSIDRKSVKETWNQREKAMKQWHAAKACWRGP